MAKKKDEELFVCIRPCYHNKTLWEKGRTATKAEIVYFIKDEEGKEVEIIPRHFEPIE